MAHNSEPSTFLASSTINPASRTTPNPDPFCEVDHPSDPKGAQETSEQPETLVEERQPVNIERVGPAVRVKTFIKSAPDQYVVAYEWPETTPQAEPRTRSRPVRRRWIAIAVGLLLVLLSATALALSW